MIDRSEPQQPSDEGASASKAKVSERTCVGCGAKIDRHDLEVVSVRVVLGPEEAPGAPREIAVDGSLREGRSAFPGGTGRGAHVHVTPACVRAAAEKGLRRSFKGE